MAEPRPPMPDGRECDECGGVMALTAIHVHELPGWRPIIDDFEGALAGYRVIEEPRWLRIVRAWRRENIVRRMLAEVPVPRYRIGNVDAEPYSYRELAELQRAGRVPEPIRWYATLLHDDLLTAEERGGG